MFSTFFPFDIFPFDIFPFDIFLFDIFPFFLFDIFPFDISTATQISFIENKLGYRDFIDITIMILFFYVRMTMGPLLRIN